MGNRTVIMLTRKEHRWLWYLMANINDGYPDDTREQKRCSGSILKKLSPLPPDISTRARRPR